MGFLSNFLATHKCGANQSRKGMPLCLQARPPRPKQRHREHRALLIFWSEFSALFEIFSYS
jgi:hypothetical protein